MAAALDNEARAGVGARLPSTSAVSPHTSSVAPLLRTTEACSAGGAAPAATVAVVGVARRGCRRNSSRPGAWKALPYPKPPPLPGPLPGRCALTPRCVSRPAPAHALLRRTLPRTNEAVKHGVAASDSLPLVCCFCPPCRRCMPPCTRSPPRPACLPVMRSRSCTRTGLTWSKCGSRCVAKRPTPFRCGARRLAGGRARRTHTTR